MASVAGRELPAGHRASRGLLLLVLVVLTVLAGLSDAFAVAAGGALRQGGHLTAALWRPLVHHGEGWVQPLLPGHGDESPTVPSVTPQPASPRPASPPPASPRPKK